MYFFATRSERLHRELATLLRICPAHGLRHDGMQISERQFHPGIPQGTRVGDKTQNHSRTQECSNGPAPPGEIAMRAAGSWPRKFDEVVLHHQVEVGKAITCWRDVCPGSMSHSGIQNHFTRSVTLPGAGTR